MFRKKSLRVTSCELRVTSLCFFISAFSFLFFGIAFANNIAVSNVALGTQNTTTDTQEIKFSVSWQNSWRDSGAPSQTANYDAAWVFLKYSNDAGNTWKHATLKGNGTNPAGYSIGSGTPIEIKVPNDTAEGNGLGCFIQRSSAGSGNLSVSDIKVIWDYGVDGIIDEDMTYSAVKVMAIEMVYITQGAFYAGDSAWGAFWNRFTRTQITHANAAQAGGRPTGAAGYYDLPATNSWPNGFNSFYLMKYELSQGQYRDFLNTLNTTQQATRCAATGEGKFMDDTGTSDIPVRRNGIQRKGTDYVCNLDLDFVYNELASSGDGEWIACNWLKWLDAIAYLDWAALRPMTEVEFEKACRGPNSSLDGENAWGTTAKTAATGITFPGQNNEKASISSANVVVGNEAGVQGPMRCGFAAYDSGDRVSAGSGYYGNMELSGNLWEMVVFSSNSQGTNFTGVNGNGVLDGSGNANVALWPTTLGVMNRADSWKGDPFALQVSDRWNVIMPTDRSDALGFRGARTY